MRTDAGGTVVQPHADFLLSWIVLSGLGVLLVDGLGVTVRHLPACRFFKDGLDLGPLTPRPPFGPSVARCFAGRRPAKLAALCVQGPR